MNINFVFAYCTENNSLIIEHPFDSSNKKYKKNLITSLKKIMNKIQINKRGEINLSKKEKKKKIFFIKYSEKNILGILSEKIDNKNMVYNFLDDFYLEFIKEEKKIDLITKKYFFEKNSEIFFWLEKNFLELEGGDRKSVFDTKRSFRKPPKKLKKKNVKEKIFLEKVKNVKDFDLEKKIDENLKNEKILEVEKILGDENLKIDKKGKNDKILENEKKIFKEKKKKKF